MRHWRFRWQVTLACAVVAGGSCAVFALAHLWLGTAVAAAAALAAIAAGSTWASIRLSAPLRALQSQAERLSLKPREVLPPIGDPVAGANPDLPARLDAAIGAGGSREIDRLRAAINRVLDHANQRVRSADRKRRLREAIFGSMAEGVMAFRNDGVLLHFNRAAADIVGIPFESARGRALEEVARDPGLRRFALALLETGERRQDEIEVRPPGGKPRHFQLNGGPLLGHDGERGFERYGAVIVMNDVTRLRELENDRRDFVANVSHELKTPLTAIHGFAEALLGDEATTAEALDPESRRRFLRIILRQSDRLIELVQDLLSLARLESGMESAAEGLQASAPASPLPLPVKDTPVREVMESAAQVCGFKARERGVKIEIDAPTSLRAQVDAPRIEEALINLIDNAIQHSPVDGVVTARAARRDQHLALEVVDHGSGIEAEHLPRLFERFYRVDKGRNRKAGGTGLGLAIVDRIARAHGGAVAVRSEPGRGSTFTVTLPSA